LLNADWHLSTELFGKSQERLAELNKYCGRIFYYIQRSLNDRVVLGIVKLLDGKPLKRLINGFSKKNLEKPDRVVLAREQRRLCDECDQLRGTFNLLVTHRDKRIAHNDNATVAPEKALDDIEMSQVKSALTDLNRLFGKISILRYGQEVDCLSGAKRDIQTSCTRFAEIIKLGNDAVDSGKRCRGL
jgi:hypothetical protein